MKKIIFISPYYVPEKGAAGLRMESFLRAVQKNKLIGHVLAPTRGKVQSTPDCTRYDSIRSLWKRLDQQQPSIVVGTTPPMTHAFVALIWCKFHRVPFILDVRDPWTFVLSRLGNYHFLNPKIWLYRFIEWCCYAFSNQVIIVYESLRDQYVPTIRSNNRVLIPNGTIPTKMAFSARLRSLTRKKSCIPKNSFVVGYAGILGGKELDQLVEAIAPFLTQTKSHLMLALVRDRDEKSQDELVEKLESIIQEKSLQKNVHFFWNVPYDELSSILSASDVMMNPLPNSVSYCLPVKSFDYFAASKVVIAKCPVGGEMDQFYQKNPAGIVIREWNQLELALKEIKNNVSFYRQIVQKNRSRVLSHYTREKSAQAFLAIIGAWLK